MSKPDYLKFAALVAEALKERGLPSSIRSGVVAGEMNGKKATFAFKTLARKCSVVPQERWAALISEHFDRAGGAQQLVAELEANIDRALPFLRVQLVTDDYLHQKAVEGLNYRRYSEELVETLVFDLPEAVQSVSHEAIKKWNLPSDELWSRVRARANEGRCKIVQGRN